MDKLKFIIAKNIQKLRQEKSMTQLELAEHLNYSDKAISKWERGESVPDIVTLKAIADRFAVSVDYLLRADHPVESEIKREYTKRQRRNHRLITLMSCALVWLVAVFVHAVVRAVLPPHEGKLWMGYMYAVPVTLIVLLIFNSIWGNRRNNFVIISALIWVALACTYISVLQLNMWLLFVIGVPAQVIVCLWAGLRYK